MIKHYKFKECWQMNWTNTREKETVMWKRTFEKSRSYILRRETEKKKEW